MGGYTPKSAVNRLGVSQRESRRDALKHEDGDVQCCNRLGCSTRLNSMKSSQIGTPGRVKSSKPSFVATSRKSMTGSSSKTYSSALNTIKNRKEPQNLSSHKETIPSETGDAQAQTQVTDVILSTTRIQAVLSQADDVESEVLKGTTINIPEEAEGCSVPSNTKALVRFSERSGLGNQNSSFRSPRILHASGKARGTGNSAFHRRDGLRKLGCTSISDVLSSGCSSSHLSHSRRAEVVKKKNNCERSANGKMMSGSSSVRSSSAQASFSRPKLPLSERPSAQQASKRFRKQPLNRDDVTSVSSQKINKDNKTTYRHGKGNKTLLPEPLGVRPQLSRSEISIRVSPPPISSQISPITRPRDSNEIVHNLLTGSVEDVSGRTFRGLSMDQDVLQHFNSEGIAEALLALERIEQDEELTYEQRLVLESTLFLDGFSFLDQHSGMRLEIDSMSYEELLDLEEKMGTVSTALTEEALSNCFQKSFYKPVRSDARGKSCADDDAKCSICQEEYSEGDEVGKLGCDHGYHMMCIHQWLRQKNWCPVCKAPAAPS